MSLFPGGAVPDGAGFRYSLDDAALADSMALFMEQEMALVYQGVKNVPLPAATTGDMRLLFVAIARGLLRYLSAKEAGNVTAELNGFFPHTHQIHLAVDMNKP
jgi:hypothetical protein